MTVVDFNKPSRRSEQSTTEQAYYWATKLDGQPSGRQLNDFKKWLAENPSHVEEFKRIAELWDGLDDYLSELLPQATADATKSTAAVNKYTGLFSNTRLNIAVCLLFTVSIASLLIAKSGFWNHYEESHSTRVGEIKTVGLPDGSDLQLNTNTHAEVNYQDNARLVHLKVGEAHFNVSHQPDKPFVVYAGDIAVQAIGTAFSVHIKKDGNVEVIVSEGTVELSSIGNMAADNLPTLSQLQDKKTLGRFGKGQRTLLADTVKTVEQKSDQELTKELSWRNGMLIFDNQPLGEVVQEVSRYTDTEIVVDESIRNMAIGGYFPAGKTDILLSTLEESFDISVNRSNTTSIQLSPKIRSTTVQ
ncbi:FecR domain-containing protein [bacterium SCSIO 12696]|nr:FecR domain-containing protein [bacterium SCSIO 12696]